MKPKFQIIALFIAFISLILLSSFVVMLVNSDSSVVRKELIYRSSEILPVVKVPASQSIPLLLFVASEVIGILPSKQTGVIHTILILFKKTGAFLLKRTFRSQ